MIKEAELHKAEDEARKSIVENRNQLEALILETEKNLDGTYKSFEGDPDYEAMKEAVKVAKASQTSNTDNAEELKKTLDTLREASMKHMAALYNKQASKKGSEPNSS